MKPQTEPQITDLDNALTQVFGEWRHVRILIGLRTGATGSQIMQTLGVDRGTAQRLARLSRQDVVDSQMLSLVPGTAAWQTVVLATERLLGAEHPHFQRFAAAVDRLAYCIGRLGGSRAAAMRARDKASEHASEHESSVRQAWSQAAMDVFGYSIDTRINIKLYRPTPGMPGRMDEATIQSLLGCRGRPGAQAITLRQFNTLDGVTLRASSTPEEARSAYVLRAGTSTPPPQLLSTGDDRTQVTIIEPNWMERSDPLDISVLRVDTGSLDWPWLSRPHVLEVESLNRYPSRTTAYLYLIHKDLDEGTSASFHAYCDRRIDSLGRPWFDRLPTQDRMARIPAPFSADHHPEFPILRPIAEESFTRLGWDGEPFVTYWVVVEHPIPLARYVFSLEKLDSD
jgi:hypothetical protein